MDPAPTPPEVVPNQPPAPPPSSAPQTSPATSPPPPAVHPENTPGIMVLQWLTYAFWGWTVLAMSILTAIVIASFIDDGDSGSSVTYGIAAVLVLLPIAAVCDFFYSKHEPSKKAGPATLIMIVHAVIFALFGIGALIAAVFSLVSMFTSSSDSSGSQIALYSALIIFVLYVVTFLRTLNPVKRIRHLSRIYLIFMIVSVGLIATLGLIGPVANERKTRDDKLIENSLPRVADGIHDYVKNNRQLPSELSAITYHGDSKKLIDTGLVEYKPNTKPTTNRNIPTDYSNPNSPKRKGTTYYYELCVTYKGAKGNNDYSSSESYEDIGTEYNSNLYVYDHPAGHKCYQLHSNDY